MKVIITHLGDIRSVAGAVAAHLGIETKDILELSHGTTVQVFDDPKSEEKETKSQDKPKTK